MTTTCIPFSSAWFSTRYSLPKEAFPVIVAYESRGQMLVCVARRYTSAEETRWYAGSDDYIGSNETVIWWTAMPEAPGYSDGR